MGHSNKSWHQLVVIGNGFDLECGLHSKFSDFASERKSHLDAFLDLDEKVVLDDSFSISECCPRLTLWDILLAGEKNGRWFDVESSIENWISPKESLPGNGIILQSRLTLLSEAIKALNDGCRKSLFDHDCSPVEIGWGSHSVYHNAARYCYAANGAEHQLYDEAALCDYMFDELHRFEREFAEYLSKEVERQTSYCDKAQELVVTLLEDHCVNSDIYEISESVLSFNYTRPAKKWRRDETPIVYANVHGQLDGEIIFGIDGRGVMNDKRIVPFTKTYRIMALDPESRNGLIHPFSVSSPSGETNLIKFYGHSLSAADYSYFQALFDSVRLYDGNTRLIFYYRPHGNGQRPEELRRFAREDMMRKAISLLATYGRTMDNKDHGENLIHKLLLEGRLMVLELPSGIVKKCS